MDKQPERFTLIQNRRSLVRSPAAQNVERLLDDLHNIIGAGTCCSGPVLRLLYRNVRVVEGVMTRILVSKGLFFRRRITLAISKALGTVGPDRDIRQTVFTQDLLHSITGRRVRVPLKDQVRDHTHRTMSLAAPRPSCLCRHQRYENPEGKA